MTHGHDQKVEERFLANYWIYKSWIFWYFHRCL